MNTQRLMIALLVAAALAWVPATAAEHKSGEPAEAAQGSGDAGGAAAQTGEAAESAGPKTAAPGSGSPLDDAFGGDFDFDKIVFEEMNYDPNGDLLLSGQVDIQSEQMNLKCQNFRYVKTDKKIYAKGSPVHIDIPDNNIKATGRNAVYNVATKQVTLDGDPVVNRYTDVDRTEFRADLIMFAQTGKGSAPSMSMKMKPGSSRLPSIQKFPLKGSTAQKAAPQKAKPVKRNNTAIIPQLESGS